MKNIILIVILFNIILIKYALANDWCNSCIGGYMNPFGLSDKSEWTNIKKDWDKRKWIIGLKTEFLTKKDDLELGAYNFPTFSPSFGLKIGRNIGLESKVPIYLSFEISRSLTYKYSKILEDARYEKNIIFWWQLELLLIFKTLSKKLFSPYIGFGSGVNNISYDFTLYKNNQVIRKHYSLASTVRMLVISIIGFESFINKELSIYLEMKLILSMDKPFVKADFDFYPPFLGVGTHFYF